MEALKKELLNFCKGFGIWFVLLILNTRSGESDVNTVKIIIDVILAVILIGNYRIGKYVAMLVAALTALITFLPIPSGLETILLIGIIILSVFLLKIAPEDKLPEHEAEPHTYDSSELYIYGSSQTSQQAQRGRKFFNPFKAGSKRNAKETCDIPWKSKNFLNPFEIYSYSPDRGISISKRSGERLYTTIPTTTTVLNIHQNGWQLLLGLCNVSFQSSLTGQRYGEYELQNIRFKSARELQSIL